MPAGFPAGTVAPGDVLVSNFNDSKNLQGTGTTIVSVSPQGTPKLFFQGSALGLTLALVALKSGFVLAGNLPTADGTSATAGPGSIQVIDAHGSLVSTIADRGFIDGPWGMTVEETGSRVHVFFSNVLGGTVTRLDATVSDGAFTVDALTDIASGFDHRGDPVALELGPAGVVLDERRDILYVVSSLDNAVYAIGDAVNRRTSAGTGTVIDRDLVHLHGPVGLTFAPNGHLLAANSDGSNVDPDQPSEIVELTVGGKFVSQFSVDPNTGGAFGLAVGPSPLGDDFRLLAAVDDNTNELQLITQPAPCGR